MRVLFIFPDLSSNVTHYTGVVSQGVALLSSLLKGEGHETALLHLTKVLDRDQFQARVAAARPDLICISSNSHYARRLPTWTKWAAEAAGVPVAVGGVHATVCPAAVEALPDVDFICVGEGEETLPELCRTLAAGDDPSCLPNVNTRQGDGWKRNDLRAVIPDLDAMPDPDYGLFEFANLYNVRRGLFPFIMSRGCAFRCTYCCCQALKDMAGNGGRYWRFESPDHASRRLQRMIARHAPDTKSVQFLDAILFPNKSWLREFAVLYKERIGLPFNCNMRADMVDDEVARIMADMGCQIVRFGVESGDPWLTSEVLDRQLTIDDLRHGFACLERVGIQRWSYNMVGLPHEDFLKALATVRLNGEIGPDLAIPFIFYPYPGTRLHDLCAEEGWLSDREFDHYFDGVSLNQRHFPEGDVLFLHRFFTKLIAMYGLARHWPEKRRKTWWALVDSLLASPLLPRGWLARTWDFYKGERHRLGEFLVKRSPRLYRVLGGTDPV